jgi:hypothetical protein
MRVRCAARRHSMRPRHDSAGEAVLCVRGTKIMNGCSGGLKKKQPKLPKLLV